MAILVAPMPPRPKRERKESKIEIMIEPSELERIEREAARLGQNVSAYIRLAVAEKMIRDGRKPADDVD
jgi:hypothetical protein